MSRALNGSTLISMQELSIGIVYFMELYYETNEGHYYADALWISGIVVHSAHSVSLPWADTDIPAAYQSAL